MKIRTVLAALAALSLNAAANATEFPTKPITFVVPLGAGGSMDVIARALAPKLQDRLGKPVVVDNRVGGGTVIAANAVANAPADGHTLLFAPSGTLTTNGFIYKSLSYDPVKSFTPVALYVKVPFVLVVNPELPVKSVAELVALSKTKPLSFGSTGTGAVPHLAGELLKAKTGMAMTHVPYKGAIPALNDVVAGHVQLTFADPSLAPQLIDGGKVRALGVSSLTRVGVLPNVPPLAEAGVPGFEAVSWHLIVAPAGTPADVVAKLHAEIKAIFAQPEMQAQLTRMGLIPVDSPPVAELNKFLAQEIEKWGAAVKQAGLVGSE